MLPDGLSRMIALFCRLPGVGEKTAQRYVLHLVANDPRGAEELGKALSELPERVAPCERCGNLAERKRLPDGTEDVRRCAICRDTRRDDRMLCVVARVQDLLAIERSGAMRGRYFVLGGLLSPLDGVRAEDLPLDRLLERLTDSDPPVEELLIATPPSVDGEATALWLSRELAPTSVKVSRIASGIPHGGDLEYADQVTLGRAIEGRKNLC